MEGKKRNGKKEGERTLAGVAQCTEHQPANKNVTGLIPSQGTCLVVGQVPSWGCGGEAPNQSLTHRYFSTSLSPSFPLFLEK